MKRYYNAGFAGGPTTPSRALGFSTVYVTTDSVPQPQEGKVLRQINNARNTLGIDRQSRYNIKVFWEGHTTGLRERNADIMYFAILGQFPRTIK